MISRLLTQGQGCASDSGAVATQVLWLWEEIAFHLTPLIGASGFRGLYARAVYLASAQCPGFSAILAGVPIASLFQTLKDDLSAMPQGDAQQCGSVLLNTFTDLVESMIGEVLMAQILRSAWVGQPRADS